MAAIILYVQQRKTLTTASPECEKWRKAHSQKQVCPVVVRGDSKEALGNAPVVMNRNYSCREHPL